MSVDTDHYVTINNKTKAFQFKLTSITEDLITTFNNH